MKVIVDLCVVPIGVGVHLVPYIAACERVLSEADAGGQGGQRPGAVVTPGLPDKAGEVLAFWFVETRPRQWFAKDAVFDGLVRDRFLGLARQALAGELDAWSKEPTGGLALVLLLDQFPHRNTALGRVSSAEELAFLQTPGSRF